MRVFIGQIEVQANNGCSSSISTGALIAPFAFLGADYDDELKGLHTNTKAADIVEARSFMAALTSDAMVPTLRARATPRRSCTEPPPDTAVGGMARAGYRLKRTARSLPAPGRPLSRVRGARDPDTSRYQSWHGWCSTAPNGPTGPRYSGARHAV